MRNFEAVYQKGIPFEDWHFTDRRLMYRESPKGIGR